MHLVIFRNRKHPGYDAAAYHADGERMLALASAQPGFIAFKTYVADDGEVVSISEWQDAASAGAWGRHPDHAAVQARGRAEYYESYTSFVCAEPRVSRFERNPA